MKFVICNFQVLHFFLRCKFLKLKKNNEKISEFEKSVFFYIFAACTTPTLHKVFFRFLKYLKEFFYCRFEKLENRNFGYVFSLPPKTVWPLVLFSNLTRIFMNEISCIIGWFLFVESVNANQLHHLLTDQTKYMRLELCSYGAL